MCCNKSKKKSEFIHNNSFLFKANGFYIPICFGCLEENFERVKEGYTDYCVSKGFDYESNYAADRFALEYICSILNLYYNDDLFNRAVVLKFQNKSNSFVQSYYKVLVNSKFEELSYISVALEKDTILKRINMSKNIDAKMIMFWGSGLPDEDYEFLQREYEDWTTRHKCESKNQEEVLKQICFIQLKISKANIKGEDTKDLLTSLQKMLDIAKLQPKQTIDDTIDDSQVYGVMIDKWENTRPIPEISEKYKDVDKIGVYLDVFLKGHLAKALNLNNGVSALYEKFIEKYTVHKPEYDNEDTEFIFNDVFGKVNDIDFISENKDTESNEEFSDE